MFSRSHKFALAYEVCGQMDKYLATNANSSASALTSVLSSSEKEVRNRAKVSFLSCLMRHLTKRSSQQADVKIRNANRAAQLMQQAYLNALNKHGLPRYRLVFC